MQPHLAARQVHRGRQPLGDRLAQHKVVDRDRGLVAVLDVGYGRVCMDKSSGFTIALIQIGEQLLSPAIQWVASIMTILLVALWLFVMVMHARAVFKKQCMMPGLNEDNDQYEDDNQ